MSKLLKCLCVAIIMATCVPAQAISTNTSTPLFLDSDKNNVNFELNQRLAGLELPMSAPSVNNAHLQRKLDDYLGGGSHSTERMLGRANQYFPVFEYYLDKHGMPESLKYLAVAESMLVPGAVSSARAAGLWQLMPATARGMGLRVDGTVDERLDIYRSTEAAVIMLKALHRQFGDWHLALAAYNCGPGRVRRAIRAAEGHTYYPKVKRFLPEESQNYVAAYVAAAYTVNYYGDYGLTPADYLLEENVSSLNVYRQLSLYRMAKACDLPVRLVRRMNPGFLRGYVPRSSGGYRLRVPLTHKWEVQRYIWGRPNLVAYEVDPEVELAGEYAASVNFDAARWLIGCNSANLRHQPSIVEHNTVCSLQLELFGAYEAIAMN